MKISFPVAFLGAVFALLLNLGWPTLLFSGMCSSLGVLSKRAGFQQTGIPGQLQVAGYLLRFLHPDGNWSDSSPHHYSLHVGAQPFQLLLAEVRSMLESTSSESEQKRVFQIYDYVTHALEVSQEAFADAFTTRFVSPESLAVGVGHKLGKENIIYGSLTPGTEHHYFLSDIQLPLILAEIYRALGYHVQLFNGGRERPGWQGQGLDDQPRPALAALFAQVPHDLGLLLVPPSRTPLGYLRTRWFAKSLVLDPYTGTVESFQKAQWGHNPKFGWVRRINHVEDGLVEWAMMTTVSKIRQAMLRAQQGQFEDLDQLILSYLKFIMPRYLDQDIVLFQAGELSETVQSFWQTGIPTLFPGMSPSLAQKSHNTWEESRRFLQRMYDKNILRPAAGALFDRPAHHEMVWALSVTLEQARKSALPHALFTLRPEAAAILIKRLGVILNLSREDGRRVYERNITKFVEESTHAMLSSYFRTHMGELSSIDEVGHPESLEDIPLWAALHPGSFFIVGADRARSWGLTQQISRSGVYESHGVLFWHLTTIDVRGIEPALVFQLIDD